MPGGRHPGKVKRAAQPPIIGNLHAVRDLIEESNQPDPNYWKGIVNLILEKLEAEWLAHPKGASPDFVSAGRKGKKANEMMLCSPFPEGHVDRDAFLEGNILVGDFGGLGKVVMPRGRALIEAGG